LHSHLRKEKDIHSV